MGSIDLFHSDRKKWRAMQLNNIKCPKTLHSFHASFVFLLFLTLVVEDLTCLLILTRWCLWKLNCSQPWSPSSLIRSDSLRKALCVPRASTLRADAQIPVSGIYSCRRTPATGNSRGMNDTLPSLHSIALHVPEEKWETQSRSYILIISPP